MPNVSAWLASMYQIQRPPMGRARSLAHEDGQRVAWKWDPPLDAHPVLPSVCGVVYAFGA
eukprot:scaffold277596_cov33-Tisochrysis_lutea.AAC.1